MGRMHKVLKGVLLAIGLPLIVAAILLLAATIRALTIEDIDYQYESLDTGVREELPDSYLEDLPEVFAGALRIPTVSTAPGDYDEEQLLVLHQYLRDRFDDALGRHYIEIMTHKVRHPIKVMTHMCVIRLFFVPNHVYMYVMEYKDFPDVFNSSFIKVEVINKYSFLFTVKGSDESVQPYLLAAHLDVVPADASKWSQPPFQGSILPDPETGEMFVWGRGAIDDKVNVMAIMMSLQYLVTSDFQPRRTFFVAFGHDEEVSGFEGAGEIGKTLQQRGVTLDFVLDEGMPITDGIVKGMDVPVAPIGVTEKGWMKVTLEVEGEGGHSSMPPKDQVAARLGRALSNLERYPQPSMFGQGPEARLFDYLAPKAKWPFKLIFANLWLFKPIMEMVMSSQRETNAIIRTTTAATMVRVGVKENVVPTSGYAVINHRVHPAQSLDEVLQHDVDVINDPKVKVIGGLRREPHPISPYGPEVPGWRLLASTIKHFFPTTAIAPGLLVGNTDTIHYMNMSSCIYRLYPVLLTKSEVARIHGIDERLSVANLRKVVGFYHRLIQAADGANSYHAEDDGDA